MFTELDNSSGRGLQDHRYQRIRKMEGNGIY